MPKTEEYKDAKGKNRIRHTADNGNVTYAIPQGYFNLADMRNTAINTSLELSEHYLENMDMKQLQKLSELGKEADSILNQPK